MIGQLSLFYNLTIIRKVVYIFAALPFAGNFADEWTNSVTPHYITRCGLKKIHRFQRGSVLCFFGGSRFCGDDAVRVDIFVFYTRLY